MNRKIVEKFFTNQATPGETRKVLEWFETPEGQQYLRERLDVDEDLMTRTELRELVPELDSEQVYSSIRQKIGKSERTTFQKRSDWLEPLLKIAAAILVVFSASLLYILHQSGQNEQAAHQELIHLQTEDEQHREVTLGDGTIVRLNSNSEMTISSDFMKGAREITLTGEAYFDVVHDPKNPFIIHTNQSSVEVLGTAFNVRSIKGMDNVQVAVVEGVVSFKHSSKENSRPLSVILSKGQYAYMDVIERTFTVDELAVENYLVWKNGRLIFDGFTLNQVCMQLSRLYDGITCSFEADDVKNLQITSNFSTDSLEKTLEVIALSLGIEYEKEENLIHWLRNS